MSDFNYSERFTYLLTPIDPNHGSDPQAVYECIRKRGLVDEHSLPMTDSLVDYLDASQITGSLLAKGLNWLHQHDFMHEWLWTSRPENYLDILKDALKTSPIACSVSAWFERDGLFVDLGQPNNHWVVIYKIDEEGIHIFDSYNHSQKTLALNHNIKRAKRIWINKKTPSAMRKHISLLESIVNMLTAKRTILSVCEAHIGTDASPRDNADDSVACVETVTTLLKQVYPSVPIMLGTYTFFEWLSDPKNGFVRVNEAIPECIVLSPTGTGNKGTVGHVGIVMSDLTIASNDSRTGKFLKNYDLPSWKRRYQEKQGMPVYIFKRLN